eukprot:gene9738-biopygen6921
MCLAAGDVPIPKNEKEALSSEHSAEWIAAMTAEMAALSEMKTWTLSELPPGSKSIGSKWVFDLKLLVSGEIDRYKAKLVAKAYAKRPRMEYDEVLAPQASRQWYLRVKADMISIGFKEVNVDQGLFILPGPSCRPLIWVLLWVDDLLLLSFHKDILKKYKETIMGLYKTRDLGEPSVFVGYEITRNSSAGTLHICQSRFIQELLMSNNMLAEPGGMRFPIPLQPEASLPNPEKGVPPTGLPI